jgi:hypothetical protein
LARLKSYPKKKQDSPLFRKLNNLNKRAGSRSNIWQVSPRCAGLASWQVSERQRWSQFHLPQAGNAGGRLIQGHDLATV